MSNAKVVMGQASNTLVKPLDVEDVFSTYLYTGDNGSNRDITNGIDLSTEGGMVWWRPRDNTDGWGLIDTERGAGKNLRTHGTFSEYTDNGLISAFNTDGYRIGGPGGSYINSSSNNYVSFSFRKAPKFFDVVTYTGNTDGSSGQTISHSLGSTPGMIIVKRTDALQSWYVSHRYDPLQVLQLNRSDAAVQDSDYQNLLGATDTTFTADYGSNTNGATYVAYLFAHNDGDGGFNGGDIIKCGSYTGNGSTDGPEIDLGFEPQWVLIKNADIVQNWYIIDNMRGMAVNVTDGDATLLPNTSGSENTANIISPLPNGFKITASNSQYNGSGNNIVYIAIRRGTKVPESASEVFDVHRTTDNASTGAAFDVGFVSDFAWHRETGATAVPWTFTRLLGGRYYLRTDGTNAEGDSTVALGYDWTLQNSVENNFDGGFPHIFYNWKRAPNFFDVVAYTGNGTAGHTVSHNLGVAPEMIWVKSRTEARNWHVWHSSFSSAANDFLYLDTTAATETTVPNMWDDGLHTDSDFKLGIYNGVNRSSQDYIAYLFASLPGISKVGSYTGNGTSQTIDCGFTSGARFVLIRGTSSNGFNWNVYDSERGIVAGNDPRLSLDTTFAEVTSVDEVDPSISGFSVTSRADVNMSGQTYIFYAIA